MSNPKDERRFPVPGCETPGRWGNASEVGLILALADAGDLLDGYLALQERGIEVGGHLEEACIELSDIEDELMRRGFARWLFAAD